jgi:hypothetical protein
MCGATRTGSKADGIAAVPATNSNSNSGNRYFALLFRMVDLVNVRAPVGRRFAISLSDGSLFT